LGDCVIIPTTVAEIVARGIVPEPQCRTKRRTLSFDTAVANKFTSALTSKRFDTLHTPNPKRALRNIY
jgi:hypothetical protein